MPAVRNERVAILLATFNGARHLSRQLDSILLQEHRDWVLYISDDGSQDSTLAIVREFQEKAGSDRVIVLAGPQAGYAANFMSMVRHQAVKGDFYAFCDQDDWWQPDKLGRALDWMRRQAADRPALYCGRTRLIDQEGRELGYSPLFTHKPHFKNALAQSLAGGNTMVLNGVARALMQQQPEDLPVASHDWWAYLVVTACGGSVYYDAKPSIGYRQHGANLIGSNAGIRSRLDRLRKMLGGSYRTWNNLNLSGLDVIETRLTQDSRRTLTLFKGTRNEWLPKRISSLVRSGIYRQTVVGNLGMILAVMLRRF